MARDQLERDLEAEIARIPLIDPHTHIDPHSPASRSLDDILGYHYYTELAHSVGLDVVSKDEQLERVLTPKAARDENRRPSPFDPTFPPRERVRAIFEHMDRFDNTAQYSWFLEIARTFLGFEGDRLTVSDSDRLFDTAERVFAQPDWPDQVLRASNVEKVFLTNEFDDTLSGFDTEKYIPCLRTDALVFDFDKREVQQRLERATGVPSKGPGELPSEAALGRLFEHFVKHGAKACAISLPPAFRVPDQPQDRLSSRMWSQKSVLYALAQKCREFGLAFDLMIGVNRYVYAWGVPKGQDLFDGRCSLIQYAGLFNEFPEVTFCVSVLSSSLNQELASYSWIFPNVVTSGHWWYSNIPAYIETDLRARLQAVPKTKQIGYYSDMYKLEFALPKYNMYRRILARVLADDFVREGKLTETGAVDLARLLLRDNVKRIFKV
jgi:glucuronate isomerase